jgi:hypothetical protein
LEGCCDPLGLNGHRNLPSYSEKKSSLDHDASRQTFYCNPPWSLAIKHVEHLRACHSTKLPLGTKEVIVLLEWSKLKAITKNSKLIKQLSKGEKALMKTSSTDTYDPPDLIPSVWIINC